MNGFYFILVALPVILGQELITDPVEEVIKLNEPGDALRLKCQLNSTDPNEPKAQFEWMFTDAEGQESPVAENHVRATEDSDESKVYFSEKDVNTGRYTCKVTPESTGRELTQSWKVYSFKVDKFEKSKTFIAGDDVILKCQLKKNSVVKGQLVFQWYIVLEDDPEGKGDLMTNSTAKSGEIDPHIRIGMPQSDLSVLKIEDALYEDRAIYRCVARLTHTSGDEIESQTQILVRIKDKYSALYPFIGIVAEVIVLSLIIFICEKRKSADDDDDDDEDYTGGVTAGNGNSNLRQRRS